MLEINVDLNVNKVATCRPQCFPDEAHRTVVNGIMGILGILLVPFCDETLASGSLGCTLLFFLTKTELSASDTVTPCSLP
jgi:hypothetical protein